MYKAKCNKGCEARPSIGEDNLVSPVQNTSPLSGEKEFGRRILQGLFHAGLASKLSRSSTACLTSLSICQYTQITLLVIANLSNFQGVFIFRVITRQRN